MSEDLFRARVEPHRAAPANEPWHDESDTNPDAVLEDLLSSFDRHRLELDERLKPEVAERPPPAEAPPLPEPNLRNEPAVLRVADRGRAADVNSAPLPSRRSAPVSRRSRKPWLIGGAALVVTVIGAGAGRTALMGGRASGASSPTSARSATSAAPSPAAPGPGAATPAADWIAANVGPKQIVACDVTICAVLRSQGFPDTSVITVQSSVTEVEQADVVAVTDIMRRQLGASLTTVTADEPLAVFTTDSSTVELRAVVLKGPRAYADRLTADRTARKAAGAALDRNRRITLTGAARTSLSEGLVDSRVCLLLAVLVGSHDITVAAFIGSGPGAGPDIPFPGVVISAIDGTEAANDTAQSAALRGLIAAQQPPYSPLSTTQVAAGANRGLVILFSQPGPIGLLNATTS